MRVRVDVVGRRARVEYSSTTDGGRAMLTVRPTGARRGYTLPMTKVAALVRAEVERAEARALRGRR